MNKDKVFYVVEKGTNIIQFIAPNKPFMGDENASRFKVNKLNKEHPDTYGYEMITITDYEEKFNQTGDTNDQK